MVNGWISLPGPPLLAARSEPFVLGTWASDDFAAYASSHGAACVVVDVASAKSTTDVIEAFQGQLQFPDWCGSGWDSVHDALDELCSAWSFPLALLVRALGDLFARVLSWRSRRRCAWTS